MSDEVKLLPCEDALIEALTPSAGTKAAYIGEFSFAIAEGMYGQRIIPVPWTTIKEIMAAIRTRAIEATDEVAETSGSREPDQERFRAMLYLLRDSQSAPNGDRVEVSAGALCDVLVMGHDVQASLTWAALSRFQSPDGTWLQIGKRDFIAAIEATRPTNQGLGVPFGSGHSRAEPEEVSVVPTSVPNALIVTIPMNLYRFLMGEGPIDGTWFDELNANLGRYWWRALLRSGAGWPASAIEARSDATVEQGAAEGESAVPQGDAHE